MLLCSCLAVCTFYCVVFGCANVWLRVCLAVCTFYCVVLGCANVWLFVHFAVWCLAFCTLVLFYIHLNGCNFKQCCTPITSCYYGNSFVSVTLTFVSYDNWYGSSDCLSFYSMCFCIFFCYQATIETAVTFTSV